MSVNLAQFAALRAAESPTPERRLIALEFAAAAWLVLDIPTASQYEAAQRMLRGVEA